MNIEKYVEEEFKNRGVISTWDVITAMKLAYNQALEDAAQYTFDLYDEETNELAEKAVIINDILSLKKQ